jgi:predicted GTPase
MEESPVQFITIDEEGKFVISKEAREILEKETNDLVVIGIVGKYRSGKSYLLNRLFKQQKGFALGI